MDDKEFFQFLEDGIALLPEKKQGQVFRDCAVNCIKDFVLKEMRRQFDECGKSLDAQYTKYGHSEYFFAEIIKPGKVYEIGYPRCLCPMVEHGFAKAPVHCECSRQSILLVLHDLLPDKNIEVETIGTVLSGSDKCKFRVVVK